MNNWRKAHTAVKAAIVRYLVRVAIVVFITLPIWRSQLTAQDHQIPILLSKGVGCLVRQDWIVDDLNQLGLHVGDFARIRYRMGAIPETLPQNPDMVNVIVYSQKQDRGWMLFFRQGADGGVRAIRNAYRLSKSRNGWMASEGNGGVATYRAVGNYATDLATEPVQRVKLKPIPESCPVEE